MSCCWPSAVAGHQLCIAGHDRLQSTGKGNANVLLSQIKCDSLGRNISEMGTGIPPKFSGENGTLYYCTIIWDKLPQELKQEEQVEISDPLD